MEKIASWKLEKSRHVHFLGISSWHTAEKALFSVPRCLQGIFRASLGKIHYTEKERMDLV